MGRASDAGSPSAATCITAWGGHYPGGPMIIRPYPTARGNNHQAQTDRPLHVARARPAGSPAVPSPDAAGCYILCRSCTACGVPLVYMHPQGKLGPQDHLRGGGRNRLKQPGEKGVEVEGEAFALTLGPVGDVLLRRSGPGIWAPSLRYLEG